VTTQTLYHFKVDKTAVTTDQPVLTGRQIMALVPGLDPNDLLELRHGDKKIPIGYDEKVEIKDGLQFVTYPGGTDS
jgi:hypothetical protein